MATPLTPAYYLNSGDVENVRKNLKDFSITQTNTSYNNLYMGAVELPVDEVFEPTLGDMNGLQYHPIRMYMSTPTGRSIEINRILDRLHWYSKLPAHQNVLRIDSLYVRNDEPLALVSRRRLIPLRAHLQADPKPNLRKLCIDLATGVDHLHSNGFAHGRLRLSNMFFDPEKGVAVLGMPSERSIPNAITLEEYTKWASPELLNPTSYRIMPIDHYRDTYRGEYRADSDIYALACTIIELYTGETPGVHHITSTRDAPSGSGLTSGGVHTAVIPTDMVHTLTLMMNFNPGRRLNSSLVEQHLSNPRLVHVRKFQPVFGKSAARKVMRSMANKASHS